MQSQDYGRPIHTEIGTLSSVTTTGNNWADVGTFNVRLLKTKELLFTATTQNLKVQVLASYDEGSTYPRTAEAEFTVTAGTSVAKTISIYCTDLKIQVKPASADTHGTLDTQMCGASF